MPETSQPMPEMSQPMPEMRQPMLEMRQPMLEMSQPMLEMSQPASHMSRAAVSPGFCAGAAEWGGRAIRKGPRKRENPQPFLGGLSGHRAKRDDRFLDTG